MNFQKLQLQKVIINHVKNLHMYTRAIDIAIYCPAASKAAPPCKRKQWNEEPVTAAFNKCRKETL